ncbi:MAG: RsmE family RNA methyltransferase, partial [Acidobacteria bacterium]|nr:RsmE family RNA methyltransferase [Acidobacteriota bacterium]
GFEEFVKTAEGAKILFAEKGGEGFAAIKPGKKITAVIGPEGGWEASELDLAQKHKFQIITLGGRILRAETAAITITAMIQNHFGDLS